MNAVTGLVRTARPRQWVKNVLVVAPLLPAGAAQLDAQAFLGAAVAFAAFCVVASAVYLVNDAKDVEADRAHPKKRFRPIASGAVSPGAAYATAAVLFVVGIGGSALWEPALAVVMAVYAAIQLVYCFGMKHEPVVELASVASGFLLRALAGGVAAGIELSEWFLLTTAFGSLFMAAGKRYAEARQGEATGRAVRKVVQKYTQTYLRFVWTLSATVLVTAYSLWAFSVLAEEAQPWSWVSVVPFVLAVLRYGVDVDRGQAEEPEELALHDRVLLGLAASWVVVLLLAVYA
ncbi:decaprenyl-phosphate phosphoribosyltransferase [Kineococcus terrestris]|uniref:decaprenyl-phosphate phosphoribosyltransferase n=1 Tax=Kineococcus terrestris TaxID=2044856 RepID=UPI0034DB7817